MPPPGTVLRPDPRRFAVAALLLAASALPLSALAADPIDKKLKELESQLEKGRAEQQQFQRKADALAEELDTVKGEMVTVARAAQESEETLSELEGQMADLKSDERLKSTALQRRREQMTGVLTALQRLAYRPSEALVAQPTSPADTVRSAILLRAAVPRIQESASELKAELAALNSLRTDIGRQKRKIASTQSKLEGEHGRLQGMFRRKVELQKEAETRGGDAARRVQKLAAEAEDLRDLMVRLEEERKQRAAEAVAKAAAEKAAREAARVAREAEIAAAKAAREAEIAAARDARAAEIEAAKAARAAELAAQKVSKDAQAAAAKAASEAALAAPVPEGKPFSQAQGQLPFPARGRIISRYGQQNEVGTVTKGITIETRAAAQVIAPYGGQVVFSGQFRGYGLLLIIEHGEGYHTLLAGMDRIDSSVGQRVVAGEPVGVMGQTEGKPTLYVELRRNGQPVNPLPWLTARKDKVSG